MDRQTHGRHLDILLEPKRDSDSQNDDFSLASLRMLLRMTFSITNWITLMMLQMMFRMMSRITLRITLRMILEMPLRMTLRLHKNMFGHLKLEQFY